MPIAASRSRSLVRATSLALVSLLAGCACWGNPVVNPPLTVSVHARADQAPIRTASVSVTFEDGTTVPFELSPSTASDAAPSVIYDAPAGSTGRGAGEHIVVHVTADGFRMADQAFDVPNDAGGCRVPYVASVLLDAQ